MKRIGITSEVLPQKVPPGEGKTRDRQGERIIWEDGERTTETFRESRQKEMVPGIGGYSPGEEASLESNRNVRSSSHRAKRKGTPKIILRQPAGQVPGERGDLK